MNEEEKNVTEEEVAQPTREEILATAREENKKGDERQRMYGTKVNMIALSVGVVVALIFFAVTSTIEERLSIEGLAVIMAVQAVQNILTAFNKTKDRTTSIVHGIIGFLEAGLAIFYLVYWILQRCGVT